MFIFGQHLGTDSFIVDALKLQVLGPKILVGEGVLLPPLWPQCDRTTITLRYVCGVPLQLLLLTSIKSLILLLHVSIKKNYAHYHNIKLINIITVM